MENLVSYLTDGRAAIWGFLLLGILAHFGIRWLSEGKLGDAVPAFNTLSFIQALTLYGSVVFVARQWAPWQMSSVPALLILSALTQWFTSRTYDQRRDEWREFLSEELKRCLRGSNAKGKRLEALVDMATYVVETDYIPTSPTQRLERLLSRKGSSRDEQRKRFCTFLKAMDYVDTQFLNSQQGLFVMSEDRRKYLARRYTVTGLFSLFLLGATTLIVSISVKGG